MYFFTSLHIKDIKIHIKYNVFTVKKYKYDFAYQIIDYLKIHLIYTWIWFFSKSLFILGNAGKVRKSTLQLFNL